MVASEQGVTVALDIQMNETLRLEGMARELVNRLQNMRKDLDFEVTDTIEVTLKESDELNAILNENKAYIQREILATTIYVAKEVNNEATELIFDSLNTQVTMVKS
jgi:isoleucyl-tRNA synthetase